MIKSKTNSHFALFDSWETLRSEITCAIFSLLLEIGTIIWKLHYQPIFYLLQKIYYMYAHTFTDTKTEICL